MEALTRLVADSLARHGFDRPVDPRRLQWSRWFRCDSTHSLLVVPSKPGIFALAEDIMDLGTSNSPVGTAVLGCPTERSSVAPPLLPANPNACWPSSSSPKTTTWPSPSTACSPAPIPCARAWPPDAVSCAL